MQTTALLAGVENHRVGRVAGDDGLTKIVRTFHARFGSVKTGAGQTPRQRIAYVRREGKYAGDAADVETTAGDKEKVIEAADRLEAGARIRRGPTADRLLATQVIELPAESTPEQRAKCAQAFVDDWRERGHPAIATVHVDGEERGQPHLHVEIAARPVHADGEVDRAVRLWRGKPTIYAERQKASDLVNRTCDPDPPYHPGGFRDIGREGDTPKKRIPAGSFRAARKGIREALAVEQAEMIDGAARVVSEAKRAPLREAHEKRTAEIVKFKAAGEWPPLSQRARLEKRVEKGFAGSDFWYRHYKNSDARETARAAERDKQRARADRAEAEREGLRGEVRQLQELNKRQTDYAADLHKKTGRELPDLATAAGQSAAFALVREVAETGLDAWLQAEAARKKREEKERKEREEREKRDRLTPGSPSYEAPETVPDPGGKVEAWQLTREQFEARGQSDEAGMRVTFGELDPPSSLVYDPGNTFKWVEKDRGRPAWLYTRGGFEALGVYAGPDAWKQAALTVYIEEVRRGLDLGREVSEAALESMGRPERAIRLGLVKHPPEPESLITVSIRDIQRVRTLDGPEIG